MTKRAFTIDQAQAGYLLGVDSRSIQTWSKRSIDPLPVAKQTPRGAPNEYDPSDLVQWYVRNELSKLDIADGEVLDLNLERARLARLQAAKVQLDLDERNGQLVPVEAAGYALDRVLSAFRSKVLGIPSKAAPHVHGCRTLEETRAELESALHEALHELASLDLDAIVKH